jgi:hypothetical protein
LTLDSETLHLRFNDWTIQEMGDPHERSNVVKHKSLFCLQYDVWESLILLAFHVVNFMILTVKCSNTSVNRFVVRRL